MAYSSQSLEATVPINRSNMGYSVSLSNTKLVIGAPRGPAGDNAGKAYIFSLAAGTWSQSSLLTPGSFGTPPYYFGCSVDNTETNVVVGAPGINTAQGGVFVYNTAGALTQTITPSQVNHRNSFGYSIRLSGTNTMFIATTGNGGRGAVLQYFSSNGTTGWTYVRPFSSNAIAPNTEGSSFGTAIAINEGKDELFIGVPYYSNKRGAVLYYKYDSGLSSWVIQQVISLTNYLPANGDLFGYSIAVKGDYMIVGAPQKLVSFGADLYSSGAAFVYQRSGLFWTVQSIISADPGPNDSFGVAVALSASGSSGLTLGLVGSNTANSQNGTLYTYNLANPANPQPAFTIKSPKLLQTRFGTSIDIIETLDNGTALVGADGNATTDAGFGDKNGQAFALKQVGTIPFTPTPTASPPIPSPTPTPTPNPTPRFLVDNWYGLANPQDPISVGDGARENTGKPFPTNYPNIPSKGGPGRNFSILRELNALFVDNPGIYSFSTFRGSIYRLSQAYNSWCLNRNLNVDNPAAMSEFCNSRGVSLAFSYTVTKRDSTPSKYCDRNDGNINISLASYPTQGRVGNPIRSATYTITIGGTSVVSSALAKSSLPNGGSYDWSIVDNNTGYTRSGNIKIGCSGAESTVETHNYKENFPVNPPV